MPSAMHATMRRHFASVAPKYSDLRTTDPQPARLISELLRPLPSIVAADVGCGTGSYDALLLNHAGDRILLHCIDSSEHMLGELKLNLGDRYAHHFEAILGQADCLPLASESQDAVVTFNAIHHFPLKEFLEEAHRVMKPGAYLLIYTRFRSQNERTVWGRYFPGFADKERRLLESEDLSETIGGIRGLTIERVVSFSYRRESSLGHLLWQSKNHHYSTFRLYSAGDFQSALAQFESNLRRRFGEGRLIRWLAENSLVIAHKGKLILPEVCRLG